MRSLALTLSFMALLHPLQSFSQETTAPTAPIVNAASNSAATLASINQAFSEGKPVARVDLTGNATWILGNGEDSGSVSLSVSQDGSATMSLTLGSGNRVESSLGSGLDTQCQWVDKGGQSHATSTANCWKPAVWFLPDFSLQPTQIKGAVSVDDLGEGTVGSSPDTLRHLQARFDLPTKSGKEAQGIARWSMTDLGVDPSTYLPSILAYTVVPDNGVESSIAVEVRYGNYRQVEGVQIPFSIQRYLNGSLQLDITLSGAQVN